jgi:hypothetical protein
MQTKPFLAATACALVVATAGTGSALAGEVKGPPGSSATEPAYTGARENANSICAYSGQNDYDPPEEVGRTAEHVQNWGQIPQEGRAELRAAGESPGDACHGGSNPNRTR